MIIKFEEYRLINEGPDVVRDRINNIIYDCNDDDAVPFVCKVNHEHTQVEDVEFGESGLYHNDINFEKKDRTYPGRIWKEGKIISFWVYPNEELFKTIIKKIESKLDIKIFNNGYKIEIIREDGDILKTKSSDKADYFFYDINYKNSELIPIEDYISSVDFSEDDKLWHLMNAKEKQAAIASGKKPKVYNGWGSYNTGWGTMNDIKWRQAKYSSESKKYK